MPDLLTAYGHAQSCTKRLGSLTLECYLQEAVGCAPAAGVHPGNQHGQRSIGRLPEPTAAAEAAPCASRRDAALRGCWVVP